MPLTNCKKCGAEISRNTGICPECGAKNRTGVSRTVGALIVIAATLAIAITAVSVIIRDDPANPAGDTTRITP